MGGGDKTQVKLKNKLLKYLVRNVHFDNKETVVVVVGVTWGLHLCVHVSMCVYKGVNLGKAGWEEMGS